MSHIPAALRRLVRDRARDRCEYCLQPEAFSFAPHSIDHIVAEKHGGETVAENLAHACILCNQKKGTDLTSIDPVSGTVVALYHPRRDRWQDHFELRDGRIEPLTPTGRATARLLGLNDPARVEERQQLIHSGVMQA